MKLRIVQDTNPENPRMWEDHLGTMACWHSRYKLGDENPSESPSEFKRELSEGTIILPLYLMDHSGLLMQTTPFSCPWDSGQVGFIYVELAKLLKEYGDTTDKTKKQAAEVLKAEVETYNYFLSGDVWCLVLEDECDKCGHPETVDSCCGFYGKDLEGITDCLEEKYWPLVKPAWEKRE